MAKNKILEADLEEDEATNTDTDDGASPFDDLSPRFVRNLDAAVAKAEGRKPAKPADEDEESEDEDLDESDETDEDEDTPPDTDATDADEESDAEVEDVDADEPRRGNSKFEKRLARADRLLDESRAQIAELQARNRESEIKDKQAANETEFTTFKGDTETKLARLKKELVAATENAETEKQIDLQDQITDLKADLRSKTQTYETAKASLETTAKRKELSPIVLAKINQWKRRNPRYATDKDFAVVVNGLDGALLAAGSDNETDEHYQALDKKLRKLYPELAPKVKAKQRRHPSAQQESGGARRSAGDAKVKIKGGKLSISPAKMERIKANMEKFGLDTSPAGIKEYVQNNPGL